ncbi:MAG: 4Fe-4S binding protein [Chloroflexi bacterium]|nr:4Fe-4S binding protein [Chloroflexota bacterium]
MTIKPIFDQEKCDGCGLCVTVCRCGALEMQNNIVNIIEVAHCGWCMDCELVCSTGALQCPFEIVTLDT